jgi:hypothetical protein
MMPGSSPPSWAPLVQAGFRFCIATEPTGTQCAGSTSQASNAGARHRADLALKNEAGAVLKGWASAWATGKWC